MSFNIFIQMELNFHKFNLLFSSFRWHRECILVWRPSNVNYLCHEALLWLTSFLAICSYLWSRFFSSYCSTLQVTPLVKKIPNPSDTLIVSKLNCKIIIWQLSWINYYYFQKMVIFLPPKKKNSQNIPILIWFDLILVFHSMKIQPIKKKTP